MLAIFSRAKYPIAVPAHTIAGSTGSRSGVLLLICGAVPEMCAVGIHGESRLAHFAIPAVFAIRIRCIRLLTARAEPVGVRTNGTRGVMRVAGGASPVMFAMLRFPQNRLA